MAISAILAPVPCVHISTGLNTCQVYGRVAFGSNAEKFFIDPTGKCTISQGSKFFITATRPEYGCAHLHKPGKAAFEAEFIRWIVADSDGKHPNENLRPVSTVDDTEFRGFWEVTALKELPKPIPFSSFSILGANKKKGFTSVMGPTKVVLDYE